MSATESLPLWTPRRRRAFHGLAAIVTLAAACVYAGAGVAGYLSRGFDADVFISAIVCALFLGSAASTAREAKRKWPAAE
jgi:hypothetical protein